MHRAQRQARQHSSISISCPASRPSGSSFSAATFNCIADQLDILDPAGAACGRMAGHYDGLRIVKTSSISSITCGGTGTQPAAHSRMPAQQAYRQPGLTGGSCLSSCGRGSAPHPAASRRQPATPGTTLALRLPS